MLLYFRIATAIKVGSDRRLILFQFNRDLDHNLRCQSPPNMEFLRKFKLLLTFVLLLALLPPSTFSSGPSRGRGKKRPAGTQHINAPPAKRPKLHSRPPASPPSSGSPSPGPSAPHSQSPQTGWKDEASPHRKQSTNSPSPPSHSSPTWPSPPARSPSPGSSSGDSIKVLYEATPVNQGDSEDPAPFVETIREYRDDGKPFSSIVWCETRDENGNVNTVEDTKRNKYLQIAYFGKNNPTPPWWAHYLFHLRKCNPEHRATASDQDAEGLIGVCKEFWASYEGQTSLRWVCDVQGNARGLFTKHVAPCSCATWYRASRNELPQEEQALFTQRCPDGAKVSDFLVAIKRQCLRHDLWRA